MSEEKMDITLFGFPVVVSDKLPEAEVIFCSPGPIQLESELINGTLTLRVKHDKDKASFARIVNLLSAPEEE